MFGITDDTFFYEKISHVHFLINTLEIFFLHEVHKNSVVIRWF